jgi:hypothetical protein
MATFVTDFMRRSADAPGDFRKRVAVGWDTRKDAERAREATYPSTGRVGKILKSISFPGSKFAGRVSLLHFGLNPSKNIRRCASNARENLKELMNFRDERVQGCEGGGYFT